jgi:hypothetical protein
MHLYNIQNSSVVILLKRESRISLSQLNLMECFQPSVTVITIHMFHKKRLKHEFFIINRVLQF